MLENQLYNLDKKAKGSKTIIVKMSNNLCPKYERNAYNVIKTISV